jgi:hypothetical protein
MFHAKNAPDEALTQVGYLSSYHGQPQTDTSLPDPEMTLGLPSMDLNNMRESSLVRALQISNMLSC